MSRVESRVDRFLATRVGELGIYFRKMLGLSRIPWSKYDTRMPQGLDVEAISNIVYTIRGENYKPSIFIHGVLPRSGTNYLADLFKFHQRIHAHPRDLWEFPLLSVTDRVTQLQNDFTRVYRHNAEVLYPFEFSAYLDSAYMKCLQSKVGSNKTMVFKFPFVHHANIFRILFPEDYQILLLRDGRDVVSSSMKTFSKGIIKRNFSDYCAEWSRATETILNYDVDGPNQHSRTIVVRFEDFIKNPCERIRELLDRVGLDCSMYNFSGLANMPVRGSSELATRSEGVHWQPYKSQNEFNPIGRWSGWPERRKRKFKRIAGEMLINAGYETSDIW